MSKKKSSSDHQFKVFVDQHTPEEIKEIQQQWRDTQKQQKSKLYNKLLLIGAIVIGIIFAILLNLFLSRTQEHQIFDDNDDNYTRIQTTFSHIQVLVAKSIDSFETKMVRAVGIVFPELMSWIEGNTLPSMKILFIPNQNSGVNILGMTLGYYLQEKASGQLHILITDPSYKHLTQKNVQLMKKIYPNRMPVTILNRTQDLSNYDLVLIENNDFHTQYSLNRFNTVVEVRKESIGNSIANAFQQYKSYQIVKGRINDNIKGFGKGYGYALMPYTPSQKDEYKSILFKKNIDPTMNLCQEIISEFKASPQLRNLVQYFRNKTVNALFYRLDSTHTLTILSELSQIKTIYTYKPFKNISTSIDLNDLPPSNLNYFVMTSQTVQIFNSKPQGTLVVMVNSDQESSKMRLKFSQANIQILSPYNNNGCFYPPHLLPYQPYQFSRPYFLIIQDSPTNGQDSN